MENLKSTFIQDVFEHLQVELAALRAKDPETNQALVEFDVCGALSAIGAKNCAVELRQAKDYTFIRIKASGEDGYYYPFEFSQRRQMTRAQYEALNGVQVAEVVATAGIFEDGEDIHTSFKWDRLITTDGEVLTFGNVRKWDGAKYDAPIAE